MTVVEMPYYRWCIIFDMSSKLCLLVLVTVLIVVSGAETHWWTSICEDTDRLHDHAPVGSATRTGGHARAREGPRSHTQGGLEVGCVCVRACMHVCTFLSWVFGVCGGWMGKWVWEGRWIQFIHNCV